MIIGSHITITRCETYLTWSGGRLVQASAGLVVYACCSITALGFVVTIDEIVHGIIYIMYCQLINMDSNGMI